MNLFYLLRALPTYTIENARDVEITLVTADSRQVIPGALFVAYPGLSVDGARFIPDALTRGAAAIVTQSPIPNPQSPISDLSERSRRSSERSGGDGDPASFPGTARQGMVADPAPPAGCAGQSPIIVVPDARAALAHLAAAWYDFPSRKLKVVGVTGTDGKTTTCTLIASILAAAGRRVGTVTTVAATIGERQVDTGLHTTTPEAVEVQRLLSEMVAADMEYAIVEATSEGLAQHRLDAVDWDVAVVTNITHEHLYFHKTWENYRDAKALLFRSLVTSFRKPNTAKVAVLNADDNERGIFHYLSGIACDEQVLYSLIRDEGPKKQDERPSSAQAAIGQERIFARDVDHSARGLRFTVVTPQGEIPIESPLLGRYNVSNILAAIGAGMALRVPFDAMREGVARVRGVVGRMQVMQQEPFIAIVDFAHTPNALRVALETAREITRGRVIVVFGCAGLRDVDKRAWMGEIAGRLADQIVITAEDPRTESLAAINAQIVEGLARAGRREQEDYWLIDDRARAIAFAVNLARDGDLVIACGKGHERSMCYGTTEYPWSDESALSTALKSV